MAELGMLPRYESYIDSGVEWIDEIPKHWSFKKLKFIDSVIMGQSPDSDSTNELKVGIPFLQGNAEFGKIYPSPNLWCTKPKKVCRKGDILFSVRAPVGAINIADQEYCIGRGLAAISVNEHDSKFRAYQMHASVSSFRKLFTGSTFEAISTEDLKNLFITCPAKNEVKPITDFLDKKTTQIDDVIATKEKQIALLKERKQIIIQQAVTRGLDLSVSMKDSGVEWIGKIPAHWQIKRAKYLFNEIDERSKTGSEELLSVSHMTGVTPRSEKNVSMFMAEDYSGSKLCKENDLVMNIMWAWMGALGVSSQTGIVSPSYGVFRQKIENTFNPIYLEYLLKTTKYIEHYNKVSTGLHSSRLRFYSHMFFSMKIGFPSYEEQNDIVDYLTKQTEKIDSALSVQQAQIEKLKEYKTTLINSAVTGKIKVA